MCKDDIRPHLGHRPGCLAGAPHRSMASPLLCLVPYAHTRTREHGKLHGWNHLLKTNRSSCNSRGGPRPPSIPRGTVPIEKWPWEWPWSGLAQPSCLRRKRVHLRHPHGSPSATRSGVGGAKWTMDRPSNIQPPTNHAAWRWRMQPRAPLLPPRAALKS